MAITRADARQWDQPTFLGLSTDVKPTGYGIGANALFYELDTKDLYYYDGSAWHKVGGDS